ncbi:hypothetical protein DYH09_07850 [bacterium CPR1]|nr:hypothetical protein [bacterium CPR1]
MRARRLELADRQTEVELLDALAQNASEDADAVELGRRDLRMEHRCRQSDLASDATLLGMLSAGAGLASSGLARAGELTAACLSGLVCLGAALAATLVARRACRLDKTEGYPVTVEDLRGRAGLYRAESEQLRAANQPKEIALQGPQAQRVGVQDRVLLIGGNRLGVRQGAFKPGG